MSVTREDTIDYYCSLKAVFVSGVLKNLAKGINPDIDRIEYEFEKSSEGSNIINEAVIIAFKSGSTRKVNVTADSYKQMTLDVLAKI